MFAYCGNNPVCRIDDSGKAWWTVPFEAILDDLIQIAEDDEEEKISYRKRSDGKAVQIKNSYKIDTPLVQWGYSAYLNYYSEYKDYFVGSTTGMVFEWTLHNLGYEAFNILAKVGDYIGVDTSQVNEWMDSCRNVDIGPTIFHDEGEGTRGTMSTAMKLTYCIIMPFHAQYDQKIYSLN
jgi:hypothetical protein